MEMIKFKENNLEVKSNDGILEDKVALIKRTIAKDATNDELELFLHVCKRTGLDPLARQIYCVHRKDRKTGEKKMAIQTSVDGFRVIAERSDKYSGQIGPFWCGEDGVWKDVWLSQKQPMAAKVGVIRSDFKEPLYAVAKLSSYMPEYNTLWSKMPEHMIAKCAEALALRRAFPQELSGLYLSEEMHQADDTDKVHQIMPTEPTVALIEPEQTAVVTPIMEVGNALITPNQQKRLFAICKVENVSSEKVKAHLLEKFQIDSSSKIKKSNYNSIIEWIYSQKQGEVHAVA